MALLSFVESAPRAYRLKASNAAPSSSTSTGTFRWLDRLELMIVIEDQFADVEMTDDDVDEIDVVGDLICHIQSVGNERRQRRIVQAPLQ